MQFLSDDMRRNPFAMYDRIRGTSPVVHVAEADLWMLFDYDDVKRALSDHDAFNSSMATAGRRNPRVVHLLRSAPPHPHAGPDLTRLHLAGHRRSRDAHPCAVARAARPPHRARHDGPRGRLRDPPIPTWPSVTASTVASRGPDHHRRPGAAADGIRFRRGYALGAAQSAARAWPGAATDPLRPGEPLG